MARNRWSASVGMGGRHASEYATVCFVNTGVRLLGLTAAHVHRACTEALKRNPELGCQIGGHSFRPFEHLIDINDDLDLATYGLSAIQTSAAGAYVHSPPAWPPEPCDDNDLVMIGGWPWRSVVEQPDSSTHDFVHFIGCSAGTSEDNLSVTLNRFTSIPYGSRSLSPDLNIGGMSGGAMCVLRHLLNPNMIVRPELVGIVYELSPKLSDLTLARPLTRIAEDGQLIRNGS